MSGSPSGVGPRVFVSYAREDEHWAVWAGSVLTQLGFRVEIDVVDWYLGDDFIARMDSGLRQADVILIMASSSYVEPARYPSLEMTAAQSLLRGDQKRVVVATLEPNVTLPIFLTTRVSIPMFGMPGPELLKRFIADFSRLKELYGASHLPQSQPLESFRLPPETPFEVATETDAREDMGLRLSVEVESGLAHLSSSAAELSDTVYIDYLASEAGRLGRTYLHKSPQLIFSEAARLRLLLTSVLERNRHPSQLSDIYLGLGRVYGVMSYAALDLGFGGSAGRLAFIALSHAVRSGDIYLQAWAHGTLSLIARFNERNRDSVEHASSGLSLPVVGTARSRLLSNAAEALANLGDEEGMKSRLAESDEQLGEAPPLYAPTIDDGIFFFPEARVHYYAASALVQLPSERTNRRAAHEAELAIDGFTKGGPLVWSFNDIQVARVHLARARVQAGELDGVLPALEDVLTAPLHLRTSWHVHFVERLKSGLVTARLDTSSDARPLVDALEKYLGETAHLAPDQDA